MITESEKVLRRAGHYCFEYRQEVYIWGGFIQYLPKVNKNINYTIKFYVKSSTIILYD